MRARNRVTQSANNLVAIFQSNRILLQKYQPSERDIGDPASLVNQASSAVDKAAVNADENQKKIWHSQRSMFKVALSSMKTMEETLCMTRNTVRLTDHILDVVSSAYLKFVEIIQEEFLIKLIPNKQSFDDILVQYDRDSRLMHEQMLHLSNLQDEMRVSQATMELSMARKQRNIIPPYTTEFMDRCSLLAEKCGASIMTMTTDAGLRCEIAIQKLLDERKIHDLSPFDKIIQETAPLWQCIQNSDVNQLEASKSTMPTTNHPVLNQFQQLSDLNSKLKLVAKLQSAVCEVDKREKDEMQHQINELTEMFLDYSMRSEEIMLCDNLLLLAEHDLRLEHQQKLKNSRRKLVELPDYINKRMEEENGGEVIRREDQQRMIPLVQVTTYRKVCNQLIDDLDYENSSESEEEYRFRYGLIPRVRKRTKKSRDAAFLARQMRKGACLAAPPPAAGQASPTSSQKTTPTNSRAASPERGAAGGAPPEAPRGAPSAAAAAAPEPQQKPKEAPKESATRPTADGNKKGRKKQSKPMARLSAPKTGSKRAKKLKAKCAVINQTLLQEGRKHRDLEGYLWVTMKTVGDNFDNPEIRKCAKATWDKMAPELKQKVKSEYAPIINTVIDKVTARIFKDKVEVRLESPPLTPKCRDTNKLWLGDVERLNRVSRMYKGPPFKTVEIKLPTSLMKRMTHNELDAVNMIATFAYENENYRQQFAKAESRLDLEGMKYVREKTRKIAFDMTYTSMSLRNLKEFDHLVKQASELNNTFKAEYAEQYKSDLTKTFIEKGFDRISNKQIIERVAMEDLTENRYKSAEKMAREYYLMRAPLKRVRAIREYECKKWDIIQAIHLAKLSLEELIRSESTDTERIESRKRIIMTARKLKKASRNETNTFIGSLNLDDILWTLNNEFHGNYRGMNECSPEDFKKIRDEQERLKAEHNAHAKQRLALANEYESLMEVMEQQEPHLSREARTQRLLHEENKSPTTDFLNLLREDNTRSDDESEDAMFDMGEKSNETIKQILQKQVEQRQKRIDEAKALNKNQEDESIEWSEGAEPPLLVKVGDQNEQPPKSADQNGQPPEPVDSSSDDDDQVPDLVNTESEEEYEPDSNEKEQKKQSEQAKPVSKGKEVPVAPAPPPSVVPPEVSAAAAGVAPPGAPHFPDEVPFKLGDRNMTLRPSGLEELPPGARITTAEELLKVISHPLYKQWREEEKAKDQQTEEFLSAEEELQSDEKCDKCTQKKKYHYDFTITDHSTSSSSSESENDDNWREMIISAITYDNEWDGSRDEIQKVDYTKAVLEEMKMHNQHENALSCQRCEPSPIQRELEAEKPKYSIVDGQLILNRPSPAAAAMQIRQKLRCARERLKAQEPVEVKAHMWWSEDTEQAAAEANDTSVVCQRHQVDSTLCKEKHTLGIPRDMFKSKSDIIDDLASKATKIRIVPDGVREEGESYWHAASRMGVDGLHNHRKITEAKFMEKLENVLQRKSSSQIMTEVANEAKSERIDHEEIHEMIRRKAYDRSDIDTWKKWDKFDKIRRLDTLSKERISEINRKNWVHFEPMVEEDENGFDSEAESAL